VDVTPDKATETKQRVEQVMRFLAEVSRRRNPVVRRWNRECGIVSFAG
jgi:uncharacterized protein YukE